MLELLKKPDIKELLFDGNLGLEKENIRVHRDGYMTLTPHPFGNKAKHPYIITDFSESQVEIGTIVCNNPDEVYDQLENLHDIVTTTISVEYPEPEFLWPISNPPLFNSGEEIPIAEYDDDNIEKHQYREYLAEKYGKEIMLYSGIHFNYSFNLKLLDRIHQELGRTDDIKYLKSEMYMRLAKNCYMYSWFPVVMTAASPVFHGTFMDEGEEVGGGRFLGYSSMRNSKYGYWNKEQLYLDYKSLDAYIDSIVDLVQNGKLYSSAEFYTPVRIKPKGKYLMKNLRDGGVNHIELRMFDLNPLDKNGMAKADMKLIEYFLIYLSTLPDFDYTPELQELSFKNHLASSAYDLDSAYITLNGKSQTITEATLEFIGQMREFFTLMEHDGALKCLDDAELRIRDQSKLYSHIVYEGIKNEGYVHFGIRRALEALKLSNEKYYLLKGFEDMELSTQALIKACLKLGVTYEVLDRKDNFIRLTREGHTEYVKQATKTSKDNCSSILLMRNKYLSKKLLAENGINAPAGKLYCEPEEAYNDYEYYVGKQIVLKPNFSNFGSGINIFKDGFSKEDYFTAVDMAFRRSNEIIIEDYFDGEDYRFLVIGNEVQAVSKRIPASVTGDGVSTIKELILQKRHHPLRGEGHTKPLGFIGMGAEEELHLKMHGMSFMTVPAKDEVVYLRNNANVSTGGDSIDCTDVVHPSYKELALKAAKSVNAVFCGVDIVAKDIKSPMTDDNYTIPELNFNPAIKLHCYPSVGQGRPIGETVVRFLFDGLL